MTNQATARTTDSEPIDRLEEKIRMLVGVVTDLRAEQTRLIEELDGLRARLAEADGVTDELVALRKERDVVRERVAEMLQQIEDLNV